MSKFRPVRKARVKISVRELGWVGTPKQRRIVYAKSYEQKCVGILEEQPVVSVAGPQRE